MPSACVSQNSLYTDAVFRDPRWNVAGTAPEDQAIGRVIEADDDIRGIADAPEILPVLVVAEARVVSAKTAGTFGPEAAPEAPAALDPPRWSPSE